MTKKDEFDKFKKESNMEGKKMDTGKLACGILNEMDRLMNEGGIITGFEICEKLTGEKHNKKFAMLVERLKSVGIIENHIHFDGKAVGQYIHLSDKGKSAIIHLRSKDIRMKKYFIVAITVYCNQKMFTSKELCKFLASTDCFESEVETAEIIENFIRSCSIEEKFTRIKGKWKRSMRLKDCAFWIFFKEDV